MNTTLTNSMTRLAGRVAIAPALAALLAGTGPALAQFTPLGMEDGPPAYITGRAGDITGTVSQEKRFLRIAPRENAPDAVMVPVFKRMAVDPWQLRFEGEVAVNDLPIYVKADQLRESARLRLRYISSVSVMPEASRMIVHVNDHQIAEIMLDSAAEQGLAEVLVPPGILQAGYNAVRLSVQQRHRVDCSIEAANELWTQVDAAGSGLVMVSAGDPINAIDDLRGMPENEDGTVPITVIIPQGGDLTALDQALRAAQALAIRADIRKPSVRVAREPSSRGGIQLFVGLRKSLAEQPGMNTLTEGGVQVFGRTGSNVTVVIAGEKTDDIDTAILRLTSEAAGREEAGTPAGLRALVFQRGTRINAESQVDLGAFGISTQEFGGRVFRTSFNVIVPADFYPADNGKATLFLDAEYPAGLLTSNEALVRINGRVAGASRLTRSGGETIVRRPIEMSLRALNPGYNRITLEIRAATDGDKDCNPLSLIGGSRRLTVLSSTSFSLPRFARANHLPNLGALSAHGYPFAGLSGPVQLFMPRPDAPSLAAAATLLSRMAIAIGQPIAVKTSLKAPDETTGAAVIVGPVADLPDWMLKHFEINAGLLPPAWQATRSQTAPTVRVGEAKTAPAAQPAPVQVAALPGVALPKAEPEPAKPAAQPAKKAEPAEKPILDRAMAGLSHFLQRNVGFRPEQLTILNGGQTTGMLAPKTSLLLAQAGAKGKSGEPWLLLAGLNADVLQRDVIELVSPAQWQQTQGQLVAYDPESRALHQVPPLREHYVQMSEHSMKNITLFAAGWLSNHIYYYVLVLLGACLIFGIFSRKLLNHVGQKP